VKPPLLGALTYRRPSGSAAKDFPFALPVIRKLRTLTFSEPVTLLVGENGTGKSTLLEALACAANSVSIGAESLRTDKTLAHARAVDEEDLQGVFPAGRGFLRLCQDNSPSAVRDEATAG
jgi:predicted ATPase